MAATAHRRIKKRQLPDGPAVMQPWTPKVGQRFRPYQPLGPGRKYHPVGVFQCTAIDNGKVVAVDIEDGDPHGWIFWAGWRFEEVETCSQKKSR